MKKYFLGFLGFLISFILIFFLIRKIDFKATLIAIKGLNYWWLAVFVFICFLNCYFKSLRWRSLFDNMDNVSVFKFMHFFVVGIMANNVLPFRMGEMVRGYLVGKKLSVSKSLAFATVLAERIFDALALLLIFVLLLLTDTGKMIPAGIRKSSVIMFIICVIIFAFVIVLSRKKDFCIEKLNVLSTSKVKETITEKIHSFFDGLCVLKNNRHIIKLASVSVTIWFIEGIAYYCMTKAFGFQIGLVGALFVMLAICLGILLPSAPAYIGVYEASCVAILVVLGINKNNALAYALVVHSLQIFMITLMGMFFIFNERLSWKEIKNMEFKK